MARLNGKIALVTGGAQGIGEGIVRRLVEEGAQVVIGDIAAAEGEALASELGDAATFARLDVSDSSTWAAAIATAKESFGPVSVLVNNAGVLRVAPLEDIAEEDIRRIYDINLLGPFLGMQAVVPDMKNAGAGSIVNVASSSGLIGMPMQAAYSSSKWGLRGLAKSAAIELGRYRIRVNTVYPGAVRSALTAGLDESMFDAYAVPRLGEPSDIGSAVAYLASEEASFVTGADLAVDGGFVLGPVPAV
nr:glucose 1-dehydrogenase [Rhodococcus sp. (in: high G+C Gram-positive bacteria)]